MLRITKNSTSKLANIKLVLTRNVYASSTTCYCTLSDDGQIDRILSSLLFKSRLPCAFTLAVKTLLSARRNLLRDRKLNPKHIFVFGQQKDVCRLTPSFDRATTVFFSCFVIIYCLQPFLNIIINGFLMSLMAECQFRPLEAL